MDVLAEIKAAVERARARKALLRYGVRLAETQKKRTQEDRDREWDSWAKSLYRSIPDFQVPKPDRTI